MNTTSLPSLSFRVVATLQFIIMLHHKNCPVLLLTRRPSLQGEVMGGHDLTKSKHMLGAQTTAPGAAAAAALPPAHPGQWAGCALPSCMPASHPSPAVPWLWSAMCPYLRPSGYKVSASLSVNVQNRLTTSLTWQTPRHDQHLWSHSHHHGFEQHLRPQRWVR